MSALPCALSSGNCSSIRSTSGRERWSARATSTQRAARVRAPASAACTAVRSAISSLEAPASGRSVASRSSVRSVARSGPGAAPVPLGTPAPVALMSAAGSPREHRRDRAREVLEILAPQARGVHAAVVDHIDVVARAQLAHLLGRDSEQREHAVLARDEAEIAARAVRGELPDHLAPQPLYALAHGIDLGAPLSP